jgi:hypothetical protein
MIDNPLFRGFGKMVIYYSAMLIFSELSANGILKTVRIKY